LPVAILFLKKHVGARLARYQLRGILHERGG
jgi:hypothetical protein